MDGAALVVTEFLAAHGGAAPFVALALAIAETVAFLSVFIPATALLMAAGALTAPSAADVKRPRAGWVAAGPRRSRPR